LLQEDIKSNARQKLFRKITTSLTAAAVLCVYSMVGLAATKDLTGEITVTGQVSVNGQSAVSNSTIVSGSTIVTGPIRALLSALEDWQNRSSGRFEHVSELSRIRASSVSCFRKGRVSNAAGVATTITTKDATVIADAGQANNFLSRLNARTLTLILHPDSYDA
jgi:hypothetical protein